jgi:hypothetical protein
MFGVRNA